MSATDMPFERLEALLRGDEPRTLEEKQRASVLSELRAGTLEAPDTLRERVLETAPGAARPSRRRSLPRRRLVLVVVPVAAMLAVGAALIHGALNSGTPAAPSLAAGPAVRQSAVVKGSPPHTAEKQHAKSGTLSSYQAYKTPAHATADRLASNGKLETPLAGLSVTAGANRVGKQYSAVTIPGNRLVHADASLEVQVGSHSALTRATNKATQIITALGGYAQSVEYQASRSGNGNAFLDLRVPVKKVNTALGRLGGLGHLVSQQVATQDLQQQFSKQTSTIGSLKRAIAIYEQALSSGSVTGTQRVEVQIRLSNAEHALTSERKARSRTVTSAATSDIQLTLTTDRHAFAVGHHKQGRLSRLLGDAGHFLGLEGVIVLYALIVLSPFIVLGGLGWGLARERRRRDERRLLANA